MGNLSKNFNREEFACKCGCGLDTVDHELVTVLEDVRNHFGGKPLYINSGCRCKKHNKASGGSDNSYHVKCKAADFWIDGVEPDDVVDYLEFMYEDRFGIGEYVGWTHIDVRSGFARWDKC